MNLKHHFYRGYYASFDPRQNAVDTAGRKRLESRNTSKLQDRNNNLHNFSPNTEVASRSLAKGVYHPGQLKIEDYTNVEPLTLETTYPGLILGTGYNHETGTKDEITLGLYFDHTSGLPIIPGSSVKGTLRSTFPQRHRRHYNEDTANAKAEFIRACLTEQLNAPGNWTDEKIDALEKHIFTNCKDVFFDAVISATNREGNIVGPDFLTPHRDKPLRDPLPLRMLKILPQVALRFSFHLADFKEGDCVLTKENKQNLFQLILLYTGIGAKTSVGYGQLMDGQTYGQRIVPADVLEAEAQKNHEIKRVEIELNQQLENERRANEVPKEWVLNRQPTPGETLEVYGQIEALNAKNKQKMAEEINPKKRRKRVKIIQKANFYPSIANKWDPRFYELEAGTYVKLTITLGNVAGDHIQIAKIDNPEIAQP